MADAISIKSVGAGGQAQFATHGNPGDIIEAKRVLGSANTINDTTKNLTNLGDFFRSRKIDPTQLAAWWNTLDEGDKRRIAESNDPWRAAADSFDIHAQPGKDAAAAAKEAEAKQVSDELAKFYNSYKQPIFDSQGNITDPTAKMLATAGAGLGAQAAYGSGGEGGMNGRLAAQAANGALVPYQQFREQMAASALTGLSNRDLGLRSLAEQGRQFDAGASFQDQANKYNSAKSVGSIIGGGLGAVGGAVATYFTGGAAAPLVPGLVQAGSAIGGGLGGAAAGTPTTGAGYKPYSGSGL